MPNRYGVEVRRHQFMEFEVIAESAEEARAKVDDYIFEQDDWASDPPEVDLYDFGEDDSDS